MVSRAEVKLLIGGLQSDLDDRFELRTCQLSATLCMRRWGGASKPLIQKDKFLAKLCVTKAFPAKLRFNVVCAAGKTGSLPPSNCSERTRAGQVSANLWVNRSAAYRSSHSRSRPGSHRVADGFSGWRAASGGVSAAVRVAATADT